MLNQMGYWSMGMDLQVVYTVAFLPTPTQSSPVPYNAFWNVISLLCFIRVTEPIVNYTTIVEMLCALLHTCLS